MEIRAWRHRQQGYVLIIALGLLLALFVMGLSLGAAVRADLAQSRRFQDETATEFLAKGGVEWVMHVLNEVEQHKSLWQASWQDEPAWFQERRLGAGTFAITYTDAHGKRHYGIRDEEARLNLNTAPYHLLAAVPGLPAVTAHAIVTQRPFATPEELVGRGLVSPSTFYGTAEQVGIGSYLTVWGSGKINLNTAPQPVLSTLPGMTSGMAEAIMRYRQGDDRQSGTADDQYFRAVDTVGEVVGIDRRSLARFANLLTVVPTVFRVIVTGRIHRATGVNRTHRRLVIIDDTARPRRILYWQRLE